jgi:hypothetical protein
MVLLTINNEVDEKTWDLRKFDQIMEFVIWILDFVCLESLFLRLIKCLFSSVGRAAHS